MNDALLSDVLRHIDEFNFKKEAGGWLRGGVCPDCSKKSLWTRADSPWVLKCGRLNKCGWERHVKDLYPELFSDWSKRARDSGAAQKNPNAAADLYMSAGRGFDLARVKGWYSQEVYHDPEAASGRGASSATVRFQFGSTWWQRIIDRPERFGDKKATFKFGASWQGQWWAPPTLDLSSARRLWITEGIFNAIALDHHDIAAVSVMSCSNYPSHALDALRKAHAERGIECTLVWALDNDPAGRNATIKHVARARADGWMCEAAQVPQHGRAKIDWNDLHQRERLEPDHLAEYLHHGAMLIAASATEKGLLIYRNSGGKRTAFVFDFGRRLYWFKLDLESFNKAVLQLEKDSTSLSEDEKRDEALKASHTIISVANCLPTPLYYQANQLTDESWYYFRVEFPHGGAPIKNTFSASSVSSATEFKKRLLAVAPGGIFTGAASVLDRYMEDKLYGISRVETVDYIGYSKEFKAYLFNGFAVHGGKTVQINDDDYFDLGKSSVKSLNQSVHLAINDDLDSYREEWFQRLWAGFGARGLVALAFWMGTLFAEQIRAAHKSWPWLEIVGEAGAGKTTLIEFMWRLVGREDYEGFDPSKSSLAARARNLAQVSNLPVVLIESDREQGTSARPGPVKSFDWDELKTTYNGRSVRARGMATGGNETYEPPFRGAIVIAQNNEVNASEAVMSRICHVHFDRSHHTPESRAEVDLLTRMSTDQVSGWLLKVVSREQELLKVIVDGAKRHQDQIIAMPGVRTVRIALNHGQIAACLDALRSVVPMTPQQHRDAVAECYAMAVQRQQTLDLDHPIVAEFWDTFDYLQGAGWPVNHSRAGELIAINLNHFVEGCKARGQTPPLISDLKRLLRSSKRHEFVECKAVNSALRDVGASAILSATVWCWVFKRRDKS